ncbi:MAG TPA: DUF309 domain-containing protein, partial [Candidatus Caldiarchaeum subterraneum]|nr:DUF309 domain-containing protein [Candidatus Caldarchaeum subterraneum]
MSGVKTRFIVLVDNRGGNYKPCDRTALVNLLRDNIAGLNDVRLIDVRVASRHIEFDLLVYSSFVSLCLVLDFLENNVGLVLEVRYVDGGEERGIIGETLAEAVKLFNEERFWEFHEVLEPLWRMSKDD